MDYTLKFVAGLPFSELASQPERRDIKVKRYHPNTGVAYEETESVWAFKLFTGQEFEKASDFLSNKVEGLTKVFKKYGLTASDYESFDHVIGIQLGGSENSSAGYNLWLKVPSPEACEKGIQKVKEKLRQMGANEKLLSKVAIYSFLDVSC